MSAPVVPEWVEVFVAEIRRGDVEDPLLRPHVMLLREREGKRTLRVWIGAAEATALALSLENAEMPRPMTDQFTANLLTATNTRVREVRITRLVEGTFYAVLILEGPGGGSEVDARPSDAVNLAMVTGVTITVSANMLDDMRVTGRTDWHSYPITGPQLVGEVRRQHEEMTRHLEPS
ncbi:MAG: bifunctional nuclease family protein [Streptosporangiaceae bacterium]|nr:bifunctional nuclease family protein [Streptosporangiaceae bacterium]